MPSCRQLPALWGEGRDDSARRPEEGRGCCQPGLSVLLGRWFATILINIEDFTAKLQKSCCASSRALWGTFGAAVKACQ